MASTRRIAIVGAGAIGASVACDLIRAGLDVTLIDQWPEHVEAIKANGLALTLCGEQIEIAANALHPFELRVGAPQFDMAILAVKAYDTRWSSELISPHLVAGGYIVGMQNALCDDDIGRAVGPSNVVSTVIELAAEVFSPGKVVRNTSHAKTWFGVGMANRSSAGDESGRSAEVAKILERVGSVTLMDDVIDGKWTKLIANSMMLGPLGMTGMRVGEVMDVPGLRGFLTAIGSEAIAVASACGHAVRPVFGLRPDELNGSPAEVSRILVDTLVSHIGPRTMVAPAQDYLKGRQTEVGAINGEIVARGRDAGIATRSNAAVVEIDRRIRQGELSPGAGNIALAVEIAAG